MTEAKNIDLKGKIPPVSMMPKRQRRWGLIASFALLFCAPVAATTTYFGYIASDRYASSAAFSIRSMDQSSSMDLFGGLTGMAASGSAVSDSYIAMSFLTSRSLVEKITNDVDLRALYSSDLADPIFRIDPNIPIEKLVDHWAKHLTANHDASSGIIEFEVDAYRPEDALLIAQRVLFHVDDLINELSDQSRHDALSAAKKETQLAEDRLAAVMKQLQAFRSENRDFDPAATAGAQISNVARMEAELSSIEARIAAATSKLDDDAPTVMALQRQADALITQITQERDFESGSVQAQSEALSNYETLQIEKTFAQQAYASAMASLESARMNADAQQRYLATFQPPSKAEYAIYPRRITNALISMIIAFAVWSISSLIAYSVRDHMT
jgi:capsular polysaccharide transport system permease protein